ncbi:SURF1-like protein [Marinobacterium nitratireducens]|uniref:SURF1-like protein n=1 Tax=Marinobacterium nitratireducens TaxID=518897 RepID=A0A918DYB0_9GAMM|nr:SURF1 family protein [Marinobacterium nitratireducens]GGO88182.1 SURF1-like protein [Marinobacterium nitratireducens]
MSKDGGATCFKWWLLCCALLLLPALVALGCWQLQRAAEKRQMLQAWNDDSRVIHHLQALGPDSADFVPAQLQGHLLPDHWLLLDNRTRDGRAGYEVVAFMPAEEALLPVNLGWMAASPDRSVLPEVELPQEALFDGRMHRLQGSLVIGEDVWDAGWPKRVQALDEQRLRQELGQDVLPWVLDLTEPVVAGLRVDRHQALMKPERHLGYAFQWFSMAAVLAGLVLWHGWNLRSRGGEFDA